MWAVYLEGEIAQNGDGWRDRDRLNTQTSQYKEGIILVEMSRIEGIVGSTESKATQTRGFQS